MSEPSPAASTRTACVWCPDWPVLARRRVDPDHRGVPLAVLERVGSRELVRAVSAEARAAGVTRGLRRREAEARCPDLELLSVDEHLDARVFAVVERAVEAFTPRIVLERPGLLQLPARGPARYFGGDGALAAHLADAVAAVLLDDGGAEAVRVGIADGAFAARLAARRAGAGAPFLVPPEESAEFLAPFPVAVVGDDALADLLRRLGLPTLGALAALPTDAVLARFGEHGARVHRLACGLDDAPPVLIAPPPDLVETAEFEPPVESVEHAAFTAKALADRLIGRLAGRGLACTQVLVEAETEHGERVARCWRHADGFTAVALTERVRWQLDGWVHGAANGECDPDLDTTTGALALVRITPEVVVPISGRQLGFWGGDAAARDRADRALARLQGMLGHDAVVTFVAQGGRTPAERARAVPWGEPREPARPLAVGGEIPAWPGALPAPSPARVHDPALPAELVGADGAPVQVSGRGEASAPPTALRCAALPGGGGRVVGWVGPWAHDVRWWDPRTRRRCARWQVVIDADGLEIACVVLLESGVFGVEAIYD